MVRAEPVLDLLVIRGVEGTIVRLLVSSLVWQLFDDVDELLLLELDDGKLLLDWLLALELLRAVERRANCSS